MYHMRRQDREIKDTDGIRAILKEGRFIVLALCRGNEPYAVTLSYGYDESANKLYMHCANEGLKLDFIRENPDVCGTVILDRGYLEGQCSHAYETVVLWGRMCFVESVGDKRKAMHTIMEHLESDPGPIIDRAMPDKALESVTILELGIERITGKKGQ